MESLAKLSPVVIGGTGGSGTRVICSILKDAGFYMGSNHNKALDALDLEPYLNHYINRILEVTHSIDYSLSDLPAQLRRGCLDDFSSTIQLYMKGMEGNHQNWGWKNPRSIYILPIISHFFPNMKFLHMVRDGRDMAISDNQNQARKHFEVFFDTPYHPSIQSSIQLWSAVNSQALRWVQQAVISGIVIKYEALCQQPMACLEQIFAQITGPVHDQLQIEALSQTVINSPNIGRHQTLPVHDKLLLSETGGSTLKLFGYT